MYPAANFLSNPRAENNNPAWPGLAWHAMGRGGFVFHSDHLGPTFSPCPAPAPAPPAAPAMCPEFLKYFSGCVFMPWIGVERQNWRGGKENEPFRLFGMLRWE